MSLKLGSITTVVISSPDVAKEMFLKHDLAFSSRQIPDAGRVVDHHKFSIAWLPVGPKWRDLRKLLASQLFTNQQLDASQGLRKKKVDELVQFAKGRSERGLGIDIGKAVSTTSLNLLSNTFFSMDFSSYDSSVSEEFKYLAWHLLEECARPNVSDFFPLLRPLDLQGVRRRQIVYFRKMMGFFERIIDERLRDQTGANEDVLGTLLKLVKEDQLTLDDVKNLLPVSFFSHLIVAVVQPQLSFLCLHLHGQRQSEAKYEPAMKNGRLQLRHKNKHLEGIDEKTNQSRPSKREKEGGPIKGCNKIKKIQEG